MYLVGYVGVWGLVVGGAREAGEAGGRWRQPHVATPYCYQKKNQGTDDGQEKTEEKMGIPGGMYFPI